MGKIKEVFMESIKAFLKGFVTNLIAWVVLACVAAAVFTVGVTSANWGFILLGVADGVALAVVFVAKLLS